MLLHKCHTKLKKMQIILESFKNHNNFTQCVALAFGCQVRQSSDIHFRQFSNQILRYVCWVELLLLYNWGHKKIMDSYNLMIHIY